MEIELSRHARLRIERRGLTIAWVEEVARRPEWREPDRSDPQLERRFGRIAEMGGRVLRVVILPISAERCRVVTAFFDRDARNPNEP
ncbi:MAG TPA: DUF4258 domain-containing protein [Beijerinckiaceae bacterium]